MTADESPSAGRIALVLGVIGVATSGPFFVMAHVDAYAAVFWRTLLAGICALSIARLRGALDIGALRRHARAIAISGSLLALHFLLWIKAFDLTDYASNLLLLVSQPVSAAVLDRMLGNALPRRAGLSLTLALVGLLMVAGADITLGPRALLGDAMCLVAGFLAAMFFVAGRDARRALSMDTFMGANFLVIAIVALPVALIADVPLWDYGAQRWTWLLAMVVITTLGGHGLLNYAARSLSIFTVNIVIVLEPVIAILIGAWLFGASISWLQAAGGLLLSSAVFPLLLMSGRDSASATKI